MLNKKDIKRILISMRNPNNENQVNNLLGKIDLLPEETLQTMIAQIGDNEESIKKYLEEKLKERNNNEHEEHTPINDMFTYGISGSCIHLHMPVDLHEMMSKNGIKKTIDTVNLYLLDAIEGIRKLQNDGFYKFNGKDSIYMISPILLGREIKFLEELDFETHSYRKKELQSEEFVAEHPEAQLAVHIFGKNSNVGTARIGLDVIKTQAWQSKRDKKVEEFGKNEITLKRDKETK